MLERVEYKGCLYDCKLDKEATSFVLHSKDETSIHLINPQSHKHTVKDIADITVINDVICYVYQNKDGLYSIKPASKHKGRMVVKECIAIGTFGEYGEYIKITCPVCGKSDYIRVKDLAKREQYDVVCIKCGTTFRINDDIH